MFGALYVSLLAFVVRLGHAAPAVPDGAPLAALGAERGWILLLLLAVWAYDTGAYLVGRQFGREQFLTHISPSKTYAGLVGGVVAATVVVAVLLWGLGQSPLHALVLGPLAALAAQAGDLAESMLKRAAGAKDSSDADPGPRWDAGPRGLVPVRGAGRDPVCRRPPRLSGAASRCWARPARSGRQAVDVLAAHPEAFRVVALATGHDGATLAEQARRLGRRSWPSPMPTAWPPGPAGRHRRRSPATTPWSSSRPATTSTSSSSRPAGSSACGPSSPRSGPARSWPRPTRRPWSPAATSSCRRPAGSPPSAPPRDRATRSPARSPGCARSTRSTRRSGSASSANRCRRVAALVLTASGGPFLDAHPGRAGGGHRRAGPPAPDLDDGRQDHDRLGDARQQGPGGHRGALAVRCRLRRDRGGHPPAERRPLRRPLRRRLPQGPAGHPGYATSHPVRHDLPRPPAVTGGAARPRRHRPARLPRARRRRGSRRCGSPAKPAWRARAPRRRSSPPTTWRSPGSSTAPSTSTASRGSSRRPSSGSAATATRSRRRRRSSRSTPRSAPPSRAARIGRSRMTGFLQSIITIVLFFAILGILVVIHELGHFVTATAGQRPGPRVRHRLVPPPGSAKVLRSTQTQGETLVHAQLAAHRRLRQARG